MEKILDFFFDVLIIDNKIILCSKYSLEIKTGCSGLKQMLLFILIIIFKKDKYGNKIWFIPLCLILIHLTNVLRMIFLLMILKYQTSIFDFAHNEISRYLLYGEIFILWFLWVEKIKMLDLSKHCFPNQNSNIFKKYIR